MQASLGWWVWSCSDRGDSERQLEKRREVLGLSCLPSLPASQELGDGAALWLSEELRGDLFGRGVRVQPGREGEDVPGKRAPPSQSSQARAQVGTTGEQIL